MVGWVGYEWLLEEVVMSCFERRWVAGEVSVVGVWSADGPHARALAV